MAMALLKTSLKAESLTSLNVKSNTWISANLARYASNTKPNQTKTFELKGYGVYDQQKPDKPLQHSTFSLHRIKDGPSTKITASRDELLDYYKKMKTMRMMEIEANKQYKDKKIRGFCHLYDGQEAIAVGMESAITRDDKVITAYRAHCHSIARGDTPHAVLSELFGKETGSARGKGGSMHMFFRNFYGGNGIVGAQTALGTGLAFAQKYSNSPNLSLAYYGDGAANQGQLYEAMNMAALWKLPIIYICENNRYGMGTSIERAAAVTSFYTRGDYIPGIRVDGMDVLAVREAGRFTKKWVADGNGPLVLEMDAYRYNGHSMSDPGISYRQRDEIKWYRDNRDPLTQTRTRLIENKLATEDELNTIDEQAKAYIAEAVEFAANAKEPAIEELTKDVYTDKEFVTP